MLRIDDMQFLRNWWYTMLRIDDMQFLRNWWYTMLRNDDIQCSALMIYNASHWWYAIPTELMIYNASHWWYTMLRNDDMQFLRNWWYTATSCGCKERSDGITSLRGFHRARHDFINIQGLRLDFDAIRHFVVIIRTAHIHRTAIPIYFNSPTRVKFSLFQGSVKNWYKNAKNLTRGRVFWKNHLIFAPN